MSGPGVHHHHPWAPPPPPPPHPPATMLVVPHIRAPPPETPHGAATTTTDEIRTVFISGLPADVKERELYNMLRWLPGFEASQINFKGEQPMGFALFSTAPHALAAKDALQDLVFDTENNATLHTEIAKKNLFVKRGMATDSNSFDQSKRLRTVGEYTHTAYPGPSPFLPPPAPVWGPPSYIAPAAPYDPYGGYPMPQVVVPTPAPLPQPSGFAPVQNTKDNPPCNTLFIGNLGENIIEEELRALFSAQPGYKQMKVLRQERNTVCFIEFDDVNSATAVHQNFQGAVLPSSGRGGMRIQFSKNPFGRRKDSVNGGAADTDGALTTHQQ